MDPARDNEIRIKNASYITLKQMLEQPGWAKGRKVQIAIAAVQARLLPLAEPAPADPAWEKLEAPVIYLTDYEYDLINKCIDHFSDSGSLRNNWVAQDLFAAFPIEEAAQ